MRSLATSASRPYRVLLGVTVAVCAVLGPLWACSNGDDLIDLGWDPDASTASETGPKADSSFGGTKDANECVGQRCKQVDCAAKGEPPTTLTGTVFDPAGRLPLYNVYVYVPNGKTSAIVPGNVECKPCQAAASGAPIVSTSTDTQGRFKLENVPAGADIPLVMQIGKWRRQIVIPHVDACAETALTDFDQTRLPRNQSEGDMPQMAFVSGCDPAECFLRRLGIADEEFTPPSGPGRVHFYRGQTGNVIPGGNTVPNTYTWWQDAKNLLKYDMIFNACECDLFDRNLEDGGTAYSAMKEYLDKGGRLFATHYYYNWFAPPTGPADFQSVIEWKEVEERDTYSQFFVDTSFPKGLAYAEWLQANGITPSYGQIPLEDLRFNMDRITDKGTRWIYGADAGDAGADASLPVYVSFNTPVGQPSEQQCGRAVFSDVHVSGGGRGIFPAYCSDPAAIHETNERALEFLFFDLSSCVQDEGEDPVHPPN